MIEKPKIYRTTLTTSDHLVPELGDGVQAQETRHHLLVAQMAGLHQSADAMLERGEGTEG